MSAFLEQQTRRGDSRIARHFCRKINIFFIERTVADACPYKAFNKAARDMCSHKPSAPSDEGAPDAVGWGRDVKEK